MCSRYKESDYFNDKLLWPIIDEYIPKHNLKLLKIKLLSNNSYSVYDDIKDVHEDINEFINDHDINIYDESFQLPNCKPLEFSLE